MLLLCRMNLAAAIVAMKFSNEYVSAISRNISLLLYIKPIIVRMIVVLVPITLMLTILSKTVGPVTPRYRQNKTRIHRNTAVYRKKYSISLLKYMSHFILHLTCHETVGYFPAESMHIILAINDIGSDSARRQRNGVR